MHFAFPPLPFDLGVAALLDFPSHALSGSPPKGVMQQRQLRLGDILDDYCPRERRLTNHAIVAMVGDQIRQTRCTTCDAEHPYKGAKISPRRKKTADSAAGAYEEVLATVSKTDGDEFTKTGRARPEGARRGQRLDNEPRASEEPEYDGQVPSSLAEDISLPDGRPVAPEAGLGNPPAMEGPEDGPVRRSLIRATLPRSDNPQASRPVPEFTIRQTRRPGKFQGRTPGARFPKGRGPVGHGPMGHDGAGRGPGGQRGPGHVARSGHHPAGSGIRSGPHQPRHSGKGGLRPRKRRSR